jgi:hypothetical protein
MDFLHLKKKVVFLNFPHRETPKHALKKNQENIISGLVGSSEAKQIYVGVRGIFFECPLGDWGLGRGSESEPEIRATSELGKITHLPKNAAYPPPHLGCFVMAMVLLAGRRAVLCDSW